MRLLFLQPVKSSVFNPIKFDKKRKVLKRIYDKSIGGKTPCGKVDLEYVK